MLFSKRHKQRPASGRTVQNDTSRYQPPLRVRRGHRSTAVRYAEKHSETRQAYYFIFFIPFAYLCVNTDCLPSVIKQSFPAAPGCQRSLRASHCPCVSHSPSSKNHKKHLQEQQSREWNRSQVTETGHYISSSFLNIGNMDYSKCGLVEQCHAPCYHQDAPCDLYIFIK